MADIEIPVSVVTTTLRPMMMTPRPAKCPKKSVWLQYFKKSPVHQEAAVCLLSQRVQSPHEKPEMF